MIWKTMIQDLETAPPTYKVLYLHPSLAPSRTSSSTTTIPVKVDNSNDDDDESNPQTRHRGNTRQVRRIMEESSFNGSVPDEVGRSSGASSCYSDDSGEGNAPPEDSTGTKYDSVVGVQPHDNDVLFGRGRPFHYHPGNLRMKRIVSELRPNYQMSSIKLKRKILEGVIRELSTCNGIPVRFLKSISKTKFGPWEEETNAVEIRKKVAHALRSTYTLRTIETPSSDDMKPQGAARRGSPPSQDETGPEVGDDAKIRHRQGQHPPSLQRPAMESQADIFFHQHILARFPHNLTQSMSSDSAIYPPPVASAFYPPTLHQNWGLYSAGHCSPQANNGLSGEPGISIPSPMVATSGGGDIPGILSQANPRTRSNIDHGEDLSSVNVNMFEDDADVDETTEPVSEDIFD